MIVIWAIGSAFSEKPFPYTSQHVVAQMFLVRGWLWLPSIDGLSWTLEIEIVFYLIAAAMASFIVGSKVKNGGGGD